MKAEVTEIAGNTDTADVTSDATSTTQAAPETELAPVSAGKVSIGGEAPGAATIESALAPTLASQSVPAVATQETRRKPSLLSRLASLIPNMGLDDRAGRALLSILLAFLLWFYVVNLENPSQTTVFNDLPVDVRGLNNGLKLIKPISPVDVSIQAPQNVLASLRPADVRPYLDLTGIAAGVHTVPVRADIRGAQTGNLSVSIGPDSTQVQLEIEATREFPVQVQVIGTPAFGYGLDAAQSEPSIVRVTGAQDMVARVSKVVTSIDVDEKAGTQRGSKPPIAQDESGSEITGLTFDPPQVQVVVPIKLLLNYKVVGVRADTRGQPAPGYRVSAITTDPNTVTICCSPTVLNNIQFLDTLPVSISGATFNVITRTELLLPPDVELYPGQSKTISVTVNVEALVTTLQVSVAPTVEGQSEGVGVVVSPDRLDLTLAGTFDQLQSLKPTDVRAFINVQGREPGTYEIRPQVVVPQGVKLESSEPEAVTVTLIPPTPVPTQTSTPVPTGTTPSNTSPPEATPTISNPVSGTASPTSTSGLP
jgi:YbbR domain-containing protein